MRKLLRLFCRTAIVITAVSLPLGAASGEVQQTETDHGRIIKRYCVGCHNERLLTGGLALDTVDITEIGNDAEIWEKVAQKLRTQTMPPTGRPRPDQAAYSLLINHLEESLDAEWASKPNTGRTTLHRLNRAEYSNAVRDLLGLSINGRALLPADESGYGFDNIADVLSVSPVLLERYILAAAKISRWALGDPTLRPTTALYQTSPLLLQEGRISDALPFGSRGGHSFEHYFPLDAEYIIRVRLGPGRRGTHKLDLRLDKKRLELFDVGGRNRGPFETRLPVKAGNREIGAAFVGGLENALPVDGSPPRPSVNTFAYRLYANNLPTVGSIEVLGPFDGTVPSKTETRTLIFSCYPNTETEELSCAEEIIRSLARRA